MTARDPKTGQLVQGDMHVLARVTLNNIKDIAEAAGSSMANVLAVNCFLADIDRDFAAWNEVYREFLPAAWPAKTTVQVAMLGRLRIEVNAVACIPAGDPGQRSQVTGDVEDATTLSEGVRFLLATRADRARSRLLHRFHFRSRQRVVDGRLSGGSHFPRRLGMHAA
jgi:enamine deaminase RidA (YjgF/YER057c/UK114 family)